MKLCALVIGHKSTSPGAEHMPSKMTEFRFNEALAQDIENEVSGVGIQRIYRRTYNTLPGDINELNPHFIISLHCNGFNTQASGTEVLYYHRSEKGKILAEILNDQLVNALGLPNRGIKAITAEDRGGYLLLNTIAPCLIAEPFFIDNDNDFHIANERRGNLVRAYSSAISAMAYEV